MNAKQQRRVLTRDEILASETFEIREVEVPEWGGPGAVTFVRELSGELRDAFITSSQERDLGVTEQQLEFLRLALCEEDGTPLFVDEDGKPLPGGEDDVKKLARKNWRPLERASTAAMKLNGLLSDSLEAAEQD